VSSEPGEDPPREAGHSSWKWIGLIGVLALLVICLNTGLFLLVQKHEREIANREIDAGRREALVAAKETQRSDLIAELSSLEARRTVALRRTDDAEKA